MSQVPRQGLERYVVRLDVTHLSRPPYAPPWPPLRSVLLHGRTKILTGDPPCSALLTKPNMPPDHILDPLPTILWSQKT